MSLDLNQIKQTLVYEYQGTIKTVHEHVDALRGLDQEQEKKERRWLILGILFLLLTVGTGVIAASEASPSFTFDSALVLALIFLLIISTIVSFVLKVINGRLNIENKRYELVDNVLTLLSADSAPDAEVQLTIDLRPRDHKSKFERSGEVHPWKVKYFRDPWLTLNGRLLDGSRYSLKVLDKLQKRSKTKRNLRGKVKFKTKEKQATDVLLLLKPKPARYARLADLAPDLQGAVQLPQWSALKKLELGEGGLNMVATTPYEWDVNLPNGKEHSHNGVELVSLMFLSLYQALNLARAVQKSDGGSTNA